MDGGIRDMVTNYEAYFVPKEGLVFIAAIDLDANLPKRQPLAPGLGAVLPLPPRGQVHGDSAES